MYFENRGGPAFVISINEQVVGTVACNHGTQLVSGDAGIPDLPWDVSLKRAPDGPSFLTQHVEHLPLYFTQIGDEPESEFSTFPVAGPPGPTCPPPS